MTASPVSAPSITVKRYSVTIKEPVTYIGGSRTTKFVVEIPAGMEMPVDDRTGESLPLDDVLSSYCYSENLHKQLPIRVLHAEVLEFTPPCEEEDPGYFDESEVQELPASA